MTRFTSFVIAGGSGMAGRGITAGLVNAGAAKVTVLSRSVATEVVAGADVKAVDFDSYDSLLESVKGYDVVISTLRDSAAAQEPILARAAKASGAQLFIPSEFGIDISELQPGEPLYYKVHNRALVAELALPTLVVVVGCFPETTFHPGRFGIDLPNGKVEIIGDGNRPVSFTTCNSIGTFLGPLLTQRDAAELQALHKIFIQGEQHTLNEVVDMYRASHPGKKVDVAYTSLDKSRELLHKTEGFQYFTRWLANTWASNDAGSSDLTLGDTRKLANDLVPEWEGDSIEHYLANLPDGPSEGSWAWADELERK